MTGIRRPNPLARKLNTAIPRGTPINVSPSKPLATFLDAGEGVTFSSSSGAVGTAEQVTPLGVVEAAWPLPGTLVIPPSVKVRAFRVKLTAGSLNATIALSAVSAGGDLTNIVRSNGRIVSYTEGGVNFSISYDASGRVTSVTQTP